MSGVDRVLPPEAGVFAHIVVGEGLYVALRVAFVPRDVSGDLAPTRPLRDSYLKQLPLLTVY
jgi:hypothetical protein